MDVRHSARFLVIGLVLLLGVWWALASAEPRQDGEYPNSRYLVTAEKLQQRLSANEPLIVVDVRDDKHFDGTLIPGAIRIPWSTFRQENSAMNMGGLFVGTDAAQEILGRHGIFRDDTVVLYDSIERDGGATASYVFWILDLLGHRNMMILEQGIDAWIDAGGTVVNEPEIREPLLYQAPVAEIDLRRLADENFIYPRLGDPFYQILDVRSRAEYLGEKLNPALDETPLKAGHIPGAYNINYQDNWSDPETKTIKAYAALQELYRGIDPDKAVIVYCHSARRSSFTYFILRLMGFDDVIVYDHSWFGWGRKDHFYPVETELRTLPGDGALPRGQTSQRTGGQISNRAKPPSASSTSGSQAGAKAKADKQGYISCGG